jgi:phosphoribosylaminoimidazole-succinocarboxamide synthase
VIPGPAILETDILGLDLFSRGKVRDTYTLDKNHLLMVTTDRISAYDHVLPNGIPDRGKVLTQLSVFWFSQTHEVIDNHLVSGMVPDLPARLQARREELAGRFMIVRKAQRIDIECVVRGYIAGSAWAEYRESGTLAGERLPHGLRESQKLYAPLFTPATKEDTGHDRNITFKEMRNKVGKELAEDLRQTSLDLYAMAAELAEKRGLILADTKFEFGLVDGKLILIDEVLTPDSSRYWDAARYQVGTTPESFDKQYVRDWLTASGWDRSSAPPELPPDVVARTRDLYLTAYERLTLRPFFIKERQ